MLVTHGIRYLPKTDRIFVLKQGRISESGTYQELLDKKGEFSKFLEEYATKKDETASSDTSSTTAAESTNCE